jgi:alanine racemase
VFKGSKAVATIDLNAIAANYRALKNICNTVEVAATIKANAYGLGAKTIEQTLYKTGCRSFYVAHYSEALELRALHTDTTLFVLHGIPNGAEAEAQHNTITGIVTDLGALARLQHHAKTSGKICAANLHVDTGMNRLGFSAKEWATLKTIPALLDGINVTHVMSHFACSDEPAHAMNKQQQQKFITETKTFSTAKLSLCNSHGIFLGNDMHFDQVRPGRALTGTNITGTPIPANSLKNALSLHAPILQLRSIDSYESVGYGAMQRVKAGSRLATLALGYADGLPRSFSNNDQVQTHHFYLHGTPVPLVGRVSMDLIVVDVSHVPEATIQIGDMVEIAGTHQRIDDVAAQIGTIGYELMTQIGHRIERNYIELA